jgi:hypothetical protein
VFYLVNLINQQQKKKKTKKRVKAAIFAYFKGKFRIIHLIFKKIKIDSID